jgi:hypothetical protein
MIFSFLGVQRCSTQIVSYSNLHLHRELSGDNLRCQPFCFIDFAAGGVNLAGQETATEQLKRDENAVYQYHGHLDPTLMQVKNYPAGRHDNSRWTVGGLLE